MLKKAVLIGAHTVKLPSFKADSRPVCVLEAQSVDKELTRQTSSPAEQKERVARSGIAHIRRLATCLPTLSTAPLQ
jgi:hypothetical protein